MHVLPLPSSAGSDRATSAWAAALLTALAREEIAGRRPVRLTEPGLATWSRFRGRLGATDLVALLFEDAAVLHAIPFAPRALGGPLLLAGIPNFDAQAWLDALPTLDLRAPSADYILALARLLGLPTRLARADLHLVKSHQRVLELPGTGGQLAHHLLTSQDGLSLQGNITVACATWQELTLAGLVGLDLGSPNSDFIARSDPKELRDPASPLRRRTFDFVVGLHPDKGGLFRIEDQLAVWFPNAKILLV